MRRTSKVAALWVVTTISALLGTSEGQIPISHVKATTGRLINFSARGRVTERDSLVVGFAITGTSARTMLLRAAGPGLRGFGVGDPLSNPRLRLRAATGSLIAENSGWANAENLASAFQQAGAFPFAANSADSALVVTLNPGIYTAEAAADSDGSSGTTLVELFDLSPPLDSRLVNVSTMAVLSSDTPEIVTGFVISGDGPQRFLVRGVGPGLTPFGIADALVDPRVVIFDSSGREIAANDDWSGRAAVGSKSQTATVAVAQSPIQLLNPTEVVAATAATRAFALAPSSADAAMVVSLLPGAYTVRVSPVPVIRPVPVAPDAPPVAVVEAAIQAAATLFTWVPSEPGVVLFEAYHVP